MNHEEQRNQLEEANRGELLEVLEAHVNSSDFNQLLGDESEAGWTRSEFVDAVEETVDEFVFKAVAWDLR